MLLDGSVIDISGESVPNVNTHCLLRVGSRCDTRVAVGRMSWLGLASGREHWPTPAFTEVDILCSDKIISSTNTMHSTLKSLQEQRELAPRVLADINHRFAVVIASPRAEATKGQTYERVNSTGFHIRPPPTPCTTPSSHCRSNGNWQ